MAVIHSLEIVDDGAQALCSGNITDIKRLSDNLDLVTCKRCLSRLATVVKKEEPVFVQADPLEAIVPSPQVEAAMPEPKVVVTEEVVPEPDVKVHVKAVKPSAKPSTKPSTKPEVVKPVVKFARSNVGNNAARIRAKLRNKRK